MLGVGGGHMPRALQQRELRHLPSQAGAHPLQQRGQEHQVSFT
jgi:hypothetical protein